MSNIERKLNHEYLQGRFRLITSRNNIDGSTTDVLYFSKVNCMVVATKVGDSIRILSCENVIVWVANRIASLGFKVLVKVVNDFF